MRNNTHADGSSSRQVTGGCDMTLTGRHAAVTAGLATFGVVCAPTAARAASTARLAGALSLPLAPFLLGLAGGLACVGVVALVSDRLEDEPRGARPSHAARGFHGAHAAHARSRVRVMSAVEEPVDRASEQVAGTDRGAHFAASAWEAEGRLRMPDERSARPRRAAHLRPATATKGSATPAAELAAVPRVEAADDYESVAQSYVAAEAKKSRRRARARGVASVLMERMDILERTPDLTGVPVIERGAPAAGYSEAWWDDVEPVTSETLVVSARAERTASERRLDAERIARDVARVEQAAYPERRTVDDLADFDDDLWNQALRAMEERVDAQAAFSDSVGGAETIDEPDGLEPATQFLNFRVPAGHSEVTDTASYVAYLLDDELSRNSSEAVRSRSRTYLRVLEGGTQPTNKLASHAGARGGERKKARGRHYATPVTPEGRHFARAAEA